MRVFGQAPSLIKSNEVSVMRAFLSGLCLLLVSVFLAPSQAFAQSAEADCRSLERSNVDCGCVAQRISVFNRASPSPDARNMIAESYRLSLGLDNNWEAAMETFMADPIQAMAATEAYDAVGGQPGNIEDFESGCVIAGAAMPSIQTPQPTPAATTYVELCSDVAGDNRWCACSAGRIERRLSATEAEAYFWGMADVRTVDPEDREVSYARRGAQMGMSGAQFAALLQRAHDSYQLHEEQDTFYCDAMTWADDNPGVDEAARLEAGFEPGTVGALSSGQVEALHAGSAPLANAREIAARNCTNNGNSEHYCACYMRDFEARIVQTSSPDVALAWALNFAGEGVTASERMSLAQSVPREAMQQSASLFASTMDLGDSCSQAAPGEDAAPTRMAGSARERMIALCTADGADARTCNCVVDRMEGALPPDDFELIVDIREAEARGADDPLAEVAAERGLTADEAEEALANNPAIIEGSMMMGQSMMQCMGGMPALPQGIPGMPRGGH